jgi:hypothetical protein
MKTKLAKEEKEILDSFEKGEWISEFINGTLIQGTTK